MRITISSPDGLGDFILRIPLIRALLDDGHRLQMLLRGPAAGLAASVFPEIERREIAADPYLPETRCRRNPFGGEIAAIRGFAADLYVAGLFSINYFDQVWMEHGDRAVRVAGFDSSDRFWPCTTTCDPREISRKFEIREEVPVALPELEKSRLLASAILGREVAHEAPKLVPRPEDLEAAEALLSKSGLGRGDYWVACVGTRSGLRNKDWGEENWRKFFSATMLTDGRPVVFLGNPKEYESIERIRSGLPSCGRSINLAGEPPPIGVSLALVFLSCGYLGRDSGVMHLAAAACRPVLAVFGGGHWGRFLPSSGPAVVVTRRVPCRGCDFFCPYEKPWCIADVRFETIRGAWERLPLATGVEVIEESERCERSLLSAGEVRELAHSAQTERQRNEQAERVKSLPARLAGKLVSRWEGGKR